MMMKRWISYILMALFLAFNPGCAVTLSPSINTPNIMAPCEARWEGGIDFLFAQRVREDIAKAEKDGCKKLNVQLLSPGGGVVWTLEVVRDIERAKEKMIVEIHGGSIIASGATFVLAAGSRGYRYARKHSVALVHGMQTSSGCSEYEEKPELEEERLHNQFIEVLAAEYARLSGRSVEETREWLRCDNTQIGGGDLLVKLGLADKIET